MCRSGILTLAHGHPFYVRMACALARSLRLHGGNVTIGIITDAREEALGGLFDHVIPLNPCLGKGLVQKLYLDAYSPFDETLFIDSDCLAYRDPAELWASCRNESGFGVCSWGFASREDQHYSVRDMRVCLERFRIERMALFNGGVYFFNRSDSACKVFSTARSILGEAAPAGLLPFGPSPVNDEPVFALAMEINAIEPLPSRSLGERPGMATALGKLTGYLGVNVLKGRSRFGKDGYVVEPVLIHYNVACKDYYMYRRELHRLEVPRWAQVTGCATLTALAEFAPVKCRYLWSRLQQRVATHGLVGAIPERFLKRPIPHGLR